MLLLGIMIVLYLEETVHFVTLDTSLPLGERPDIFCLANVGNYFLYIIGFPAFSRFSRP